MKLPHWPIPNGSNPINMGLTRIQELLTRLSHPELKVPPVVHVAGTNGKGSTIAYLKSILVKSGYKVHSYTSPHLMRFNERITVAGQEIDDQLLTEAIEECRIAAADLQLTFFEGTTAAAFLVFSKVPADILLLETGLGGRLDATNVIPKPLLSIITPISLDHVEYLGATISAIAQEKAGIIKKQVPCVISWQMQEAMEVLKTQCNLQYAPYFAWHEHWDFYSNFKGFEFQDEDSTFDFPLPSLHGIHQVVNAATAIASLQLLEGFAITKNDIDYGLTHTHWPARLQQMHNCKLYHMLPPDSEMWLDGAHNVAGAEMLMASIKNMAKKLPLYLINGRSKNRDISAFLHYFLGEVEFFCSTYVQSEPLSEDSKKIYDIATSMGFSGYCSDSVTDAIAACVKHAQGKAIRILVCGSLYLAGDMLCRSSQLFAIA